VLVESSSSRVWDVEGGKHLLEEFLADGRELGEFPMVGGRVCGEVGNVPAEEEGECRVVLVVVAAMISASDW